MPSTLRIRFSLIFLLTLAFPALPGFTPECQAAKAPEEDILRLDSGPIVRNPDGVYQGIPYAAPPTGDLRWKAPQPAPAWTEPREFDEPGPVCPQPTADGDPMSEDCLYLNVTTPARSPDARLPVMVYIHGGAFIGGAGSLEIYEGEALTDKSVVLVTINYRLGALGYLAHPLLSEESPDNVSGNYGLLDQLKALKWVKTNIAAFGGDPDKVTVFGQSAGAESVCLLLVSPPAKGLFRAAIAESPVMTGSLRPLRKSLLTRFLGVGPDVVPAEEVGKALAARLGADKAPDVLAAMRRAPYEDIAKASKDFWKKYGLNVISMVWGPAVDGRVVPDHPVTLFKKGLWNAVPLMTGFNADESSAFLPGLAPDMFTPEGLSSYAAASFGPMAGARVLDALDSMEGAGLTGERARVARLLSATWFEAWNEFMAEEAAASGQSVYAYRFTRPIPQGAMDILTDEAGADAMPVEELGVPHSAEIFSVFGFTPFLLGFDGEDDAFANEVSAYWANFARTGDPNGPGLPRWPGFRPGPDARCQELGGTIQSVPCPDGPLSGPIRETWLDAIY